MDDVVGFQQGQGRRVSSLLARSFALGILFCGGAAGAQTESGSAPKEPPAEIAPAVTPAPAIKLTGNEAARQREAKNLKRLGLNLDWRKATLAELKQTEADIIAIGDDKDARLRVIAAARLREYGVRVSWRRLTSEQLMDRLLAALDAARAVEIAGQNSPSVPPADAPEASAPIVDTDSTPASEIAETTPAPATIYVEPAPAPTTVYINQPYPVYIDPPYSAPWTFYNAPYYSPFYSSYAPPFVSVPIHPRPQHYHGGSSNFSHPPINHLPARPPAHGGSGGNRPIGGFGGGQSRPGHAFNDNGSGSGYQSGGGETPARPAIRREPARVHGNEVRPFTASNVTPAAPAFTPAPVSRPAPPTFARNAPTDSFVPAPISAFRARTPAPPANYNLTPPTPAPSVRVAPRQEPRPVPPPTVSPAPKPTPSPAPAPTSSDAAKLKETLRKFLKRS